MPNDRKASELISRSMDGALSDDDTRDVQQNLAESTEARNFAKLSEMIQNSVSGIAQLSDVGDESVAPGLSLEAKQRLRESVQAAKRESVQLGGLTDASDPDKPSRATWHGRAFGDAEGLRRANLRFTLIRKIAEGGLGTVWFARDEALKRTVAIKEMNTDVAESPKAWQRFQREAQITGHLEHPGIVPLYMFGMDADTGHPFCAMRFVGKQTLADAIEAYHARKSVGRDDNLELHRLLSAFLDVCQTIAYAHSRGVIHRDLKPENVALDRFGQVIVLDWGLAKLTGDGELSIQLALSPNLDDSSLAQSIAGDVIGTPLYMAPEQAVGDLDKVDERTDVYGLGAILFSILTGAAPHERSSQGGAVRVSDLLKAIAENETPKPRAFSQQISPELDSICLQAMAKERFARHATALELANDVERWMAGQNEQGRMYDALRLEANELRSSLTSSIRDLGTVARFVGILPPIQELINIENGDGSEASAKWCERLATICIGLLRTRPVLSAITYSRVADDTTRELVRVERHSVDLSSIRTVPRSRLLEGGLDPFGSAVLSQKPEDVFVDVVSDAASATLVATPELQRLVAGVPIFDNRTEDVIGLVTVELDFTGLIEAEIGAYSQNADEVFVVNNQGVVVKHHRGNTHRQAEGKSADQFFSNWDAMATQLASLGEFVDSNRAIYATRVDLIPRVSSLAIVLVAKTAK